MRTGFPCNESRFFPLGIDLQGKAVSYTGFGFAVHDKYKPKLILFGNLKKKNPIENWKNHQ